MKKHSVRVRQVLAVLLALCCLIPAAGFSAGVNPELGEGTGGDSSFTDEFGPGTDSLLDEEDPEEDPFWDEDDPEDDPEEDPFWDEDDPEEDPYWDEEDPEEDPYWDEEDPEDEISVPAPPAARDPLNPVGAVSARKLSSWTWYRPVSVTATSCASGNRSPANLSDGREDTCWEFSAQDTPLGQAYAYFTFAEPVNVRELWIKNGIWQTVGGRSQYLRYARPKSIQISYLYSGKKQYADTMKAKIRDDAALTDWARISLHPPKRVVGVRIRIMSLFKGSDNPYDVCISEVLFAGPKSRSSEPSLSTWPSTAGQPVRRTAQPTARRTAQPTARPYYTAPPDYSIPLYAQAITKLATRSGPGTQYSEPGTFNVQGQWIRILSRAYANGVWWVQCVIPWRNQEIIAWTGWKRFDPASLDLELVPLYMENPPIQDEMVPVG